MKILSGSDLAGFIKQRQLQQVSYCKSRSAKPKLAVIQTIDDEVINTYVRLKIAYGEDIGVEVERHVVKSEDCLNLINQLNKDDSVHGIIVQLPLDKSLDQTEVLNAVSADKDVDGLASESKFDPATPTAIMWLIAGYNIETRGKQILVIGQGVLVGGPLARILLNAGNNVVTADDKTADLETLVASSDIIVTATGSAGLITSAMIPENAVVLDAGVAVESGVKVGDLADDVYEREDIKVTPKVGGVGPLTVCALFDNVIKAALESLKASS